jgi:hypothetical protein
MTMAGRSVDFVFYATDDQAREILAEVSIQGFGEVRLLKGTDEHGEPIDGSVSVSLRRFWVDCRQDRFRWSG